MKPFLERTDDPALIASIITNPRVWRWVSDGADGASFVPVIHPDVHYLTWGAGLFAFKRVKGECYETHAFSPVGADVDTGIAALAWMFSNTDAEKVFCFIPSYIRHAVRYARSVGFIEDGRLTKAVRHRGRMRDMILLGVSKWAEQ
ncbi:hypothetical protein H0A71_06585 [Alcaligenaceae bacterium]|nr:hypothetical protein [Alcaligenaceae bacterium]